MHLWHVAPVCAIQHASAFVCLHPAKALGGRLFRDFLVKSRITILSGKEESPPTQLCRSSRRCLHRIHECRAYAAAF
jgi:hypothetical protein